VKARSCSAELQVISEVPQQAFLHTVYLRRTSLT
jgi:hypothetical protein